ncbi:MAG TPA: DUF559 domain-containing protein [Nitrospirae bacterium]|nr:DUF559 domain-containing protein [Nitrospirota bacterium]
MTDAEKLLWSSIRNKQLKGYQFYRQKISGNYIVDFYEYAGCMPRSLIGDECQRYKYQYSLLGSPDLWSGSFTVRRRI